jgi:hypothetical protein
VLGTFFLCPTIFFQVSFLGYINGKNCWYSYFSCVRQLYEMKGVKVTAVVAHYIKCIRIVVVVDPLRSMEKRKYFSVLSWWTNSMFLTHSSPLFFVAWHLYWIERLCLFCNTAPSTVLRKVIKETVVPEAQKIVGCVTSWRTGGLWVSFKHCVSLAVLCVWCLFLVCKK